MFSSAEQPQAPNAEGVHDFLRKMFIREFPLGPPHLFERLLPKLPELTNMLVRERIDAILHYEVGDVPESYLIDPLHARRALAPFFDPLVLRAHLEVGRDATLSNDRHSIAHFDTQQPVVTNELLRIAASDHPEALERIGCVFFDVDGTKTIVDCTSHPHAGRYLEKLAEFLCKPPPEIMAWLAQRKLNVQAYSYAGDEFVSIVRSYDGPLSVSLLKEFSRIVQDGIAANAELTSFVSFDDPEFVMRYAEWNAEDTTRHLRDCSASADRFAQARQLLPERFIPSVSCGSATLLEGLVGALDAHDDLSAVHLEDLGARAYRLMVDLADARLGRDKEEFRRDMPDAKWRSFLLRNAENRRLERLNDELQGRMADLERRYALLLEQVQTLHAHNGNGAALVAPEGGKLPNEKDLAVKN